MINTFINPTVNNASELGLSLFTETEPLQLWGGASQEEIETIILAVYRQVLGNIHVMESERLSVHESQLKCGEITVQEFVRQVALSELYRSRFFHNCAQNRAIELNFKHLLGRAPESMEELREHVRILAEEGYEAEIDSYIRSDEYQEAFGENIVPYYRGYKTQTGQNLVGFTYMLRLLRGSPSSDLSGFFKNQSRLQKLIMTKSPGKKEQLLKVASPWKPAWGVGNNNAKGSVSSYDPIVVEAQRKAQQQALQRQYQSFQDVSVIRLVPGSSPAEVDTVIRAVYRQVLGNAHVMASERLSVPESQLKQGTIAVREFVRQVAKSELYRSRFFDACPRYRSIELNFKHLLGRAPNDYTETFAHSSILDKGGFEAEIDSYLDSDEYQDAFGDDIVPFNRGYKTQTGQKLLGFTNMFKLLKSVSTSDKAGSSGMESRLVKPLIYNNPQGNAPITDINALLAEVLKPKLWLRQSSEASVQQEAAPTQDYIELEQKCQEQESLRATLQKQLAELQPFANIGAAQLGKWNSDTAVTSVSSTSYTSQGTEPTDSYQLLQNKSQELETQITSLRSKIADAQRLATIGAAKLNKWRSRSF